MIPEADLLRARARLADVIGADIALKPKGHELCGLCPVHNEKTPSFYVNPIKGFYHCFGCGVHGDAIDWVMRRGGLDFVEAVRFLLDLPPAPKKARATPIETSSPRETESGTADRVRAILAGCGPVTDRTAARLYLWSRGLKPDQPALLAHPALFCSEVGKPLPALVAPITNSLGEITAVQRIWCADRVEFDGTADRWKDARAQLATRKKTLGRMGDGAVRLAPAGAILGLGEGCETAIAASTMYRLPVWAVCGAARLGHVWIPDDVRQVVIFGDNGTAGRNLALLAQAELTQRVACQIAFPDDGFSDFADQLIGKRSAA